WLVVDTATASRAEAFIDLLRECLGTLPVVPLQVAESPDAVMTEWLKESGVPAAIQIGDECELRDLMEDGAIVRVRREDLFSDEIRVHLEAGKRAMRLALTWEERVSFLLDRCQPWRAKRRLVAPSSREAALLTRRAHSARGKAK
ncbi:recombination-associated protein RdgC, partial [Thiolapillus sp.]